MRIDGAGATHDLLEHLEALNTAGRTVRYLVGWTITEDDEKAIAKLPARAWEASLCQDGDIQDGYGIAELTGVNTRPGWPEGMRLLVRRVRPAGRHRKKLTTFELKTGWKYSVIATNIRHMWGIPGSHQPQWLDAVAREHAVVEDGVRADKAMGLRNLPSKSWEVNRGWMLAANLGHDLDCWSGCWPCTTGPTWNGPSRTRCATGSTICPPVSRPMPAAAGCGSTAPSPGPKCSSSPSGD
ncbi:hypothetical protein ACFWIQ_09545 [Kitasatospora sp. NPDC127059]|uniref:hypothetical protein n=1 Tax=unclassified Kitasatospora TaxID=2633591 RepID=UPI0036515EF5